MQITDYLTIYSALDISVPHIMPTAFRAVSTARRLGGSDGRIQPTPVQPRPYSSPAVSALLPARRASPSGGPAVRDKGVTYYSVDLGRVQRRGRDNDADRDVTVIPVIPGRRAHQGRAVAPVTTGRARPAVEGSGPGRCRPRCRHARSPVPVAHGALLPLIGSCRRAGSPVPVAHGRSSLGRRGFSRCPSSPVPVAHCRSFRVAGLFRM
jgi:hypothetical protein